jgi:hypothetical protein
MEHAPNRFQGTSRGQSPLRKARVRSHVHPEQIHVGPALALCSIDLSLRHAHARLGFEYIWPPRERTWLKRARPR